MTEPQAAPFTANYHRYGERCSEPCSSVGEAVGFLADRWASGELSQNSVTGPDGKVLLDGHELLDAMGAHLRS